MRTAERPVILSVEPMRLGRVEVRGGEEKAGGEDGPSFERKVGFERGGQVGRRTF